MSMGLYTATTEIYVGNGVRVKDDERLESLRGHVDVTVSGQRSRADKKHTLSIDEFAMFVLDLRIGLHMFLL